MEKKPQVVILIGPPGAGKDTQGDMLAEDFGFSHLQTSKIIEQHFKDADPNDALVNTQKELFRTGKLVDPTVVQQWISEWIRTESEQNHSLVFSGSPRTRLEAEAGVPLLEQVYGKENVHPVNIQVSEAESIKRNSKRRICKANRHPIPNFTEYENITTCPKDGSEIETRILDNPETIKVRYATYLEETMPSLEVFKEHGYSIIVINGEQSIRKVHQDILLAIDVFGHSKLLEKFGE